MENELFQILEIDGTARLVLNIQSGRFISEKQAWEFSIKKWEFLYHLCEKGKLVADGGVKSCALCKVYFYGYDDECEQCPIKKAGFMACDNTPHREYLAAVYLGDLKLAQEAALDEIKFLRSIQNGA